MLKQRVISAVALLPLPMLAFYFGSPWFELFCVVLIGAMSWEWEKLTLKRFSVLGMIIALTATTGLFLLDMNQYVAWALPAVVATVLYFVAKKQQLENPRLFAFGMLYIGYPILSLSYIFMNFGCLFTLWAVGLVWAMDTGAYAFGKTIGGPKLCPKISPKKTWAGLIGGMLTAAAWGVGCAYFLNIDYVWAVVVTAILAVISQVGDLFESAIKRRMGVKDSSDLIPGHGGVFDRTDAILIVLPIVVFLATVVFPDVIY